MDTSVGRARAGTPFTERQWRNLLNDIHDGLVAVVAGPELAVGGDEPGSRFLYQHLADELVRRLDLDQTLLPTSYGLLDASSLYLQDPHNEADDLYREMRDVFQALQWPVSEPFRHLAAISGLNVFVSTTFDSLLEDALNQVRFAGARRTSVLTYSEKAQIKDVPGDFDSAPHPTVFHLFGKLNASGDYVLTEEKLLEYAHRLQSRDLRPPNLFDMLRVKHLLVLGCSLPGWLARFTLRATKGDVLLNQGARGSIVADRTSCADQEFALFLERRKVSPYYEGDAVQFVTELHRRWEAQFGGAERKTTPPPPEAEAFKADSVFLSYASEDLAEAIRVKRALDEAGIDVWFDKSRLESGDTFSLVIEKNIENCSYFVPLISHNTARMDKRFFQREWKKGIDEAAAWPEGYPFIQPILIDDVELSAPGIPDTFRKYHARRLDDLPAFIEDAKKRIRERRQTRRAG